MGVCFTAWVFVSDTQTFVCMSVSTLPSVRCIQCQSLWPGGTKTCVYCDLSGYLIPDGGRPPTLLDQPLSMSASDLAQRSWTLISTGLEGVRVTRGSLILLTGAPGSGKSTLALQMLASHNDPAVVVVAEERLGASVGERLHRVGLRRKNVELVDSASIDDLVVRCSRGGVRWLVIDSVQSTSLMPSDLRSLITSCRLDALVGVSQVTKSGSMRGTRVLEHEADVIVELRGKGDWSLTKSRSQEVSDA